MLKVPEHVRVGHLSAGIRRWGEARIASALWPCSVRMQSALGSPRALGLDVVAVHGVGTDPGNASIFCH